MIKVNLRDAKAKLARFFRELGGGRRIVPCKRNVPSAEPVLLSSRKTRARPIGLARGEFEVPAAFFDPLPEDEARAFEGRSS